MWKCGFLTLLATKLPHISLLLGWSYNSNWFVWQYTQKRICCWSHNRVGINLISKLTSIIFLCQIFTVYHSFSVSVSFVSLWCTSSIIYKHHRNKHAEERKVREYFKELKSEFERKRGWVLSGLRELNGAEKSEMIECECAPAKHTDTRTYISWEGARSWSLSLGRSPKTHTHPCLVSFNLTLLCIASHQWGLFLCKPRPDSASRQCRGSRSAGTVFTVMDKPAQEIRLCSAEEWLTH